MVDVYKRQDQTGEVEVLDLLITQGIAATGIEIGHRLGNHLQVDHRFGGCGGIPVLEGDLVADGTGRSTCIENQVVAVLAQRQVGIEPVSYTHLDVYKRQALSCAR